MDTIERKPIIKFFPKQQLIDWGLPYENPAIFDKDNNIVAEGKIILNKIVDKHRWSLEYEIIFTEPEDNNKVWKTYYTKGSTENQDERPWYSYDFIKCTLMQEVEKIVKVWEEVLED